MVEVSNISRLIDGATRNISLSTNTIVVDNIKIRLGSLNSVTFSGFLTGDRTIACPDEDLDLGNLISLNALTGVAEGSTNLGTFTGSIISDNRTIKVALQELETFIEDNSASNVFSDSSFRILDNEDISKILAFQASPISQNSTRTIIMADEDVDLADIGKLKQDISVLQTLRSMMPIKEKHAIGASVENLTYIDLQFLAVDLTMQVYIDRLLLHEGDDYTLSEVNGLTRITWTGDVAAGGNQALDSTDVIRVSYCIYLERLIPAKEKHELDADPTALLYIDLEYEALPSTLQVSVDRLLLHENDDYVTSVVNGVTRITWIGDVAAGGNQALDSTDVIRVSYFYYYEI